MTDPRLLTIGVRGELHSHIDTLLASATPRLGEKVKREMMQSVVEVGTTICADVRAARDQLAEMRSTLAELLVKTGSIDDGKKIWWDLRAHPHFPTIEFRCCDQPTRLEETICLVALTQAICAKLLSLRTRNLGFRKYLPALIAENKWRAMRYGLDGKLIDFGKQAEVPMRDLALELLEFVDDVVDDLGSRDAVEYVHTLLAHGTSADRQLAAFARTGDVVPVVEQLAEETLAGIAVA